MTATVHSFPALNTPGSGRGWVLVLIALLHVGFFYLLTSGLARPVIEFLAPPIQVSFEELEPEPRREPDLPSVGDPIVSDPIPLPPEPTPIPDWADPVPVPTSAPTPSATAGSARNPAPPKPVVVEPAIPARGLSEPVYPPSEIRQGHTGTVVLAIYVLEDGRIGDVRVDESSGYPRLDDSAVREARRWRLVPGTRNGKPAAMWRQLPVTFRLDN